MPWGENDYWREEQNRWEERNREYNDRKREEKREFDRDLDYIFDTGWKDQRKSRKKRKQNDITNFDLEEESLTSKKSQTKEEPESESAFCGILGSVISTMAYVITIAGVAFFVISGIGLVFQYARCIFDVDYSVSSRQEYVYQEVFKEVKQIELNTENKVKLNKNFITVEKRVPFWKAYEINIDKAGWYSVSLQSFSKFNKYRYAYKIVTKENTKEDINNLNNYYVGCTSKEDKDTSRNFYFPKGTFYVLVSTQNDFNMIKRKAKLSVIFKDEFDGYEEGTKAVNGVTPVEFGKQYLGKISEDGEIDKYSFKIDEEKYIEKLITFSTVSSGLSEKSMVIKNSEGDVITSAPMGRKWIFHLEPGAYSIEITKEKAYPNDVYVFSIL